MVLETVCPERSVSVREVCIAFCRGFYTLLMHIEAAMVKAGELMIATIN